MGHKEYLNLVAPVGEDRIVDALLGSCERQPQGAQQRMPTSLRNFLWWTLVVATVGALLWASFSQPNLLAWIGVVYIVPFIAPMATG
jgi:hypothetical protein